MRPPTPALGVVRAPAAACVRAVLAVARASAAFAFARASAASRVARAIAAAASALAGAARALGASDARARARPALARTRAACLALAAAVSPAAAADPAPAPAAPLAIGFVYVGPVGDHGWTHRHDLARRAVEARFGDRVRTTVVESVPEGPDAERALRALAKSGHGLIFATSFGFMDAVLAVAREFPEVRFEHATGFKRAPNVSTYAGRFYEGRHVLGLIAGRMTRTNLIGYVASHPIPEVVRGINAAFLAARSVNPEVRMRVVWADAWFDPVREAEAARALIAEGADVILQHTDSPAPVEAAEAAGVLAFGQVSDMSRFGPNAHLSAIVDTWTPYTLRRVQAALDGSWESTDTWDGIAEGMVEIAPFNPALPPEVRAEAMNAAIAIAGGRLHPFTGPIARQDGTPWLAEGEIADDGALLGMTFLVEGLEDPLPD